MKASISAIMALYSIVTTLCVILAMIIIDGTKKITSLARASNVDFILDPIDCNIIEVDLIIQVRTIPPRNIFRQYLAYSKYSLELPLPNIFIM